MPLNPEEIAAQYPGQITYLAANLQNGWEIGRYADTPMRTASVVKVAVMVEAFAQVAEGRREWEMPLILDNKTSVGGSGILPVLSDGLRLSLRDCMTLMIVVSDNTATNMVLDALEGGPAAVNARMASLGFPLTTVFRKAFSPDNPNDPIGKQFGLGRTTAREAVGLLSGLARGEIVSEQTSADMVAVLKHQQDKDGLARRLPEDLIVASKSGRLSDVRNDVGLVYLPDGRGPLALAIFCDGQPPSSTYRPDDIGLETIAELSATLVAELRKS